MKITYIIVTRNPGNGKLEVIRQSDGEAVAEFDSESIAFDVARGTSCCRAWGAEIVPIGGMTLAGPWPRVTIKD